MDRRDFFRGAVGASAALAAGRDATAKGELRDAQYVIVELMGFKKLCGRLSQGIAGLLQLDVPVEGGFITQFINPQSIYRLTVVSADVVKEYAKHVDPLPAIELSVTPTARHIEYDRWDS